MSEELAVCIFTVTDAVFWGDFTASRTVMTNVRIFSDSDAGFWGEFAASRMIVAPDRDASKDNRGWLSVNKTFSHPLNTNPLPVAILNKKCLPPAGDKHLMNNGLKTFYCYTLLDFHLTIYDIEFIHVCTYSCCCIFVFNSKIALCSS